MEGRHQVTALTRTRLHRGLPEAAVLLLGSVALYGVPAWASPAVEPGPPQVAVVPSRPHGAEVMRVTWKEPAFWAALPMPPGTSGVASVIELHRVGDDTAKAGASRINRPPSDLVPMLSDDLASYPEVAKDDLRERVVMARVHAVYPDLAATVDDAGSAPRALSVSVAAGRSPGALARADVAVANDRLTRRYPPVGDMARGEIDAFPGLARSGSGRAYARYADAHDLDIEEIALDDLGEVALAGLHDPVATGDLRETRAGFVLRNGVKIDFAVTRYTAVDGIDRLHTIANLPEGLDVHVLSRIAGGNHSNNQLRMPDSGPALTLIQNDLNNQRIIDVTAIDIGIGNLGLRAIDFLPPALLTDAIPAELRR